MVKNPLLALAGGATALALFISITPAYADPGPKDDAGSNKRALFGTGEVRDGLYTPSIEEFLKRAYPSDDVPPEATTAASERLGRLEPKWRGSSRNMAADRTEHRARSGRPELARRQLRPTLPRAA